jgi:MFS family permease
MDLDRSAWPRRCCCSTSPPNIALPVIAAELAAGFTARLWVLSVCVLVLASVLLAAGVLADRFTVGGRSCPGCVSEGSAWHRREEQPRRHPASSASGDGRGGAIFSWPWH